jgi:hypothetical protein
MKEEAKQYTVFTRVSDGDIGVFLSSCRAEGHQRTLDGLIEFAAGYVGYGDVCHTPIAWVPSEDWAHEEDELPAAIAAGRTIELVDGRYVARGVPAEEQDPDTDPEGDAIRALLESALKEYDANQRMIERDGPAKAVAAFVRSESKPTAKPPLAAPLTCRRAATRPIRLSAVRRC